MRYLKEPYKLFKETSVFLDGDEMKIYFRPPKRLGGRYSKFLLFYEGNLKLFQVDEDIVVLARTESEVSKNFPGAKNIKKL